MPPPVKVFLCDDVSSFRRLMRFALEDDGSVTIVGEAADGEAGIAGVAETQPDVVLLDISMPKLDGLSAIPRMKTAAPGTAIVMLSSMADESVGPRSLGLGADRYIMKGAELDEIRDTILAAARERGGDQAG